MRRFHYAGIAADADLCTDYDHWGSGPEKTDPDTGQPGPDYAARPVHRISGHHPFRCDRGRAPYRRCGTGICVRRHPGDAGHAHGECFPDSPAAGIRQGREGHRQRHGRLHEYRFHGRSHDRCPLWERLLGWDLLMDL